jgi:hypothetical protein
VNVVQSGAAVPFGWVSIDKTISTQKLLSGKTAKMSKSMPLLQHEGDKRDNQRDDVETNLFTDREQHRRVRRLKRTRMISTSYIKAGRHASYDIFNLELPRSREYGETKRLNFGSASQNTSLFHVSSRDPGGGPPQNRNTESDLAWFQELELGMASGR